MPWSVKTPPSCAKNWTDAEKAKCVEAGNAVLREGGSEQDAIFACIHNAGKTQHPGGKKQDAEGGLSLELVTTEDIAQYSNHALLAEYKPAELMKFKNAIFCRAGVNANKDAIDEQGIRELRDSLSFMAIDDEHVPQKVVGFFVNPRDADNSSTLITDGIIYAGRFPEIAKQVESGEKKLSVEAGAQKAECSVCNKVFASRNEYCEHIRETPYKDGAVRRLHTLKARGGATVRAPAWNTEFDTNAITFIASQMEFEPKEVKVEVPKWVTDLTAKIEGLINRLKPIPETKGGATMSDVKVDELNLVELGLVQASELATKDAEVQSLKVGFARVLELGLEASQLEILAGMTEEAYQLLKSQQQKPVVQASVVVEPAPVVPVQNVVLEGSTATLTVPLTWGTVPTILKIK